MKTIKYLLCLLTISAAAQLPIDQESGKVVFKTIIELDSFYTASKIYSLVHQWFQSNAKEFNRSNSDNHINTGDVLLGTQRGNSAQIDLLYKNDQPLKFQDGSKKMVGKGVLKYTGGSMGCIRVLYLEFDINVAIKDFRSKIEITNFNYTHYNQMSMSQTQIWGWSDKGPCNSKNTIEQLLTCDRCPGEFDKFYGFLSGEMTKISGSLNTFLKNSKSSDDDKW